MRTARREGPQVARWVALAPRRLRSVPDDDRRAAVEGVDPRGEEERRV